jgi:WbqC-like protein family
MRHISRLIEADEVVVLDEGPTPDRNKNSFVNRNLVWDSKLQRFLWLTVPLLRSRDTLIKDVLINPTDFRWKDKHLGSMRNAYGDLNSNAPNAIAHIAKALKKDNKKLVDLNFSIIRSICEYIEIDVPNIVRFSDIVLNGHRQSRLDIARSLDATHYIAGEVEWSIMESSGEMSEFNLEGISVLRSPPLDANLFDFVDSTKVSIVGHLCKYGRKQTQKKIFLMRDFCHRSWNL